MQQGERKKYLMKNTMIFTLGNLGPKLVSFLLVPFYTHLLTPDEYGTIDLFSTICMVLVPILTLNVVEAVMRFSLDKDSDKNAIMTTAIYCLIISIMVGSLVFPVVKMMGNIVPLANYLYFFVILQGVSQVLLGYLRGTEKLLEYSVGNILLSLLIASLNILFLDVFNKGVEGYFLSYIIAYIITSTYAFFSGNVIEVFKGFKYDSKLSREMIKYSVVLIPDTFMWWIMNSSDRIMVTMMMGTAENGIYSVAYKVPTIMLTLSTIFNQSWSYSAIREQESKDKEAYSNYIYDGLVSVTIVVAVGLLAVMKIFLKYYAGNEYYTAWKYTPFLMIGFVFMTLGNFIATYYTVHKDSKGLLLSGVLGGVINVALNVILINFVGTVGAAIATCLSYICVYGYRAYDIKKYLRIEILRTKHLCGYLLLMLVAVTMYIDNEMGQIFLILEFVIALLLFRNFWFKIIISIGSKLKGKKTFEGR